ncbi:MAG: Protoporphyrinogen oxidase [Candidatus Moanabacter tarae]|uniref:Coproporphyrinogen III oxidase n=1 Tax=Candidatus Moanibacter tarae TaxID=2200854 RepID=A0A2Z4AE38_9BACT|nr:MAG: Protoporphyrinogen oxidase [Candidatus Moanabacter tarae]|tara:strand:+ start:34756 stop:36126 length:1371 start_codon:yes stop_codon:yes gene_type:complete
MKKVAIVGGGITGLTAAHRLRQNHVEVTLFESSSRVGGVVRTETSNGFLAETGPNSIWLKEKRILSFFHELGLESEIIEADPNIRKRFIVREGRPVEISSTPLSLLTTPILSLSGKFRLLQEPFIKSGGLSQDESLANFVRRRIGKEALDYAIDPIVSGIFAGDPEKLSARFAFPTLWNLEKKFGSLVGGQLKRIKHSKSTGNRMKRRSVTFKKGIQSLTDAIRASLGDSIRLNSDVNRLLSESNWRVLWSNGKSGSCGSEKFDALVLALPAYKCSRLLFSDNAVQPLSFLKEIEYPPLAVQVMGFERSKIKHPLDGMGMLVPAVEGLNILGTFFSSTAFPGRSPAGHATLTTFIGGARNPNLGQNSSTQLQSLVLQDLERLLGVGGEPVFSRSYLWNNSIPQYNIGYGKILAKISEFESSNSGIFLSGNYRNGIALRQCINSGLDTADKVMSYLG